ncbi:MAG TPA: DNA polymerase/3'-5' exonuclease PolX [Candidatus Dormibacteraeota bacterium]|nr:DNA polymerase/3'-5' exonuclease PolX [Candidatus Dormibacteraeota bacterium]
MRNAEVAAMLNRVADLLEIKGENFFKIRAYREAVRQLDNLTIEVEQLIREGKLKDVPSIGPAIAQKITEYVTTGQLEFLTRLEAEIPPALLELTRVPGLGPRTAKDIYDTLGVLSLEELEAAALSHRLLQVPGIKAKTEENILKGIAQLKRTESRIFFPEAWILADSFLLTLRSLPGVVRAEIAGSVRRARETVRDLDLLVASDDPDAISREFARLPQVNEVISQAPAMTTIRVRSGMEVDLRAVRPESFGAAWQQYTGSPAHNAQLQAQAARVGKLTINESGVFGPDGTRLAGATEEEVYSAIGCAWIPPELREGWGEVELAANGSLPALVQQRDLRGDLHTHSNWSDGRQEIAVMVRAATERGYDYIAMTDHTQSLQIAQGLTPERFRERAREIAAVNARSGGARVLNGAEVDILPDGSLDLPDDSLASLDLVVASVHTALDQPKDVITQRVLSALRSPHVDVLAHPTSRRLDRRGETSLDIDAVIAEAVKTGTALEINSSPWRLDLNDSWARKAREAGAMLAIDTDAHYPAEFDSARYGCAIARRAGLSPDRILNTRDAEGVLAHGRAKAARAVANFR